MRQYKWKSFINYILRIMMGYSIILSGVRLSPLGTAATTGLFYQLQTINDGDCGAIGGMKIGRGSQSTVRKPALPQIPHDQNRAWTEAAAMESQRLTAWAMVRPLWWVLSQCLNLVFIIVTLSWFWSWWNLSPWLWRLRDLECNVSETAVW
jgi:hypothetical protein